MKLKAKILSDLKQALKQGEKAKLTNLRYLNAQIQNKEISKGREELSDEELLNLIKGQIKKIEESLSHFKKAKRENLISQAKAEIEVLKTYLPAQLSDKELEKEIEKIINQNPSVVHPGPMIGICIKALSGKADNQKISQIVMKKMAQ
jgi:uncharacterized protein YqeY